MCCGDQRHNLKVVPWLCPCTRLWLVQVSTHDAIIKWKHFRRYWPFVWRIHRSLVNSSHKGQWCGALMFSLICTAELRLSCTNPSISACRAGIQIIGFQNMFCFITATELFSQCWSFIRVILYKCQRVSNHYQLDCLLNNLFRLTTTKENIQIPHYWPFVRGIHQWPVDSPHKGPAMWKTFPCNDMIMVAVYQCWHGSGYEWSNDWTQSNL